ncbi:MAG: acetyltransferase [Bacteroidota bacterium]
MKEIILYGAGGHCFATVELINGSGHAKAIVIYDDVPSREEILGVPVQKFNETLVAPDDAVCIAIGDNEIRKEISATLKANFPSFIHLSATVYPSVNVGKGCQILPGVVLDGAVSVGDFCIINNNATVSHNTEIGDFCHIAINAAIAGGVTIGEGALIGAGSIVLPGINIGKWAVVGAGAVITKDVPDHAVIYGNPSKIIRYNKR